MASNDSGNCSDNWLDETNTDSRNNCCAYGKSDTNANDECRTHRQNNEFYCLQCRCHLCKECVNDSDHLRPPFHYHDDKQAILSTKEAIQQLKNDLFEKMENMSTFLSSVDYYNDDVENQKLRLELAWLARKEDIRLEFVALHSLLIEREEELISRIEEDVQTVLAEMSCLKEVKEKLEHEEIEISDECLNLVQDKVLSDVDTFSKKQEILIEKCNSFIEEIKRLPNTEEMWPVYLKAPFSMYTEKVYLDKTLQFDSFNNYYITSKSKILHIPFSDFTKPLFCRDFIDKMDSFPPSTSCVFDVTVHTDFRQVLSHSSVTMDFCIFNSPGQPSLLPGSLYVLIFQPVFSCVRNNGHISLFRGDSVSVMVLTDCSVEKFIPYCKISDPVFCKDLISIPDSQPNPVFVTYNIDIQYGPSKVWNYSSVSPSFSVFNEDWKLQLEPNTLYHLELYPSFTTVDGKGRRVIVQGNKLTVRLLTGKEEKEEEEEESSRNIIENLHETS